MRKDRLRSDWTAAKIAALKPRDRRYVAGIGGGLELEVMPSGVKSWRRRLTRNGRPARETLGHWPALSLHDAQVMAAGIRFRWTVKDFAERWLAEIVERDRKDAEPVRRVLEREVFPRIGGRPLSQVKSRELQAIIFAKRDGGAPASAAAVRDVLKRLWDYAIACGVAEVNPAGVIPRRYVARAVKRDRVLDAGELRLFVAALRSFEGRQPRVRGRETQGSGLRGQGSEKQGRGPNVRREWLAALELLLLTLARKSELRLARWREFDLEGGVWEIPAERMKGGKAQMVYLPERALALLRGMSREADLTRPVFAAHNAVWTPMGGSTLNRALAEVRRVCRLKHFTVHDLRRTAATLLNEMGWEDRVVEKALAHAKKGIQGVYNRAEFAEQRRAMLAAWAAWLDGLLRDIEARKSTKR